MSTALPLSCPSRRALMRAGLGLGLTLGGVTLAQVVAAAAPPADMVSLDQARADLAAGRAIVIDIREPDEHARGVAAGARLLPMSQLKQRLAEIPLAPTKPVLLICNTQNRSSSTLQALRSRPGYEHVRYVEGGMSEWVRRGWPVVAPAR